METIDIMPLRQFLSLACMILSCLASMLMVPGARADQPFDYRAWSFISNEGTYAYLGLGLGLPLIEDGRAGRNHALRATDALVTSLLLENGLKSIIIEKWPNGTTHRSFPSGHSAAAFSVASVESALHPRQAVYWYTGATLIAASRVAIHVHTVADILAGSALGYGIGRLEMSTRRGILLFPLITPDHRAAGLSFIASF
jgi:membrane-associated phospholipid phosphatase